MLTRCQFVNFKSWEDTGPIQLSPLTVFFGRNSSGKSSLLQADLMMKQTAESLDPRQVLDLGNQDSYADLGTYRDIVRDHDMQRHVRLNFTWTADNPIVLRQVGDMPLMSNTFSFATEIGLEDGKRQQLGEVLVYNMKYEIGHGGNRTLSDGKHGPDA